MEIHTIKMRLLSRRGEKAEALDGVPLATTPPKKLPLGLGLKVFVAKLLG
jgi:hypothetical protein